MYLKPRCMFRFNDNTKGVSFLILLFISFCLMSCEDQIVNHDPSVALSFSADTISFDTIFTQKGSATQRLKVYNNSNNKLVISSIELNGTQNFAININGVKTDALQNVEILAKDSMTIFVQVYIDPSNQNTPFLVTDSISFLTNTNRQQVILTAYGQDAYRISKKTINVDTVWQAEKPYLISDTLKVSAGKTLALQEGVKLFFAKGATLQVEGTLLANGTKQNPVVFRGDRQDKMFDNLPYDKVPGQWSGIRFLTGSTGNEMKYVVVKNATSGIQVDSSAIDTPILKMENSFVGNMSGNCIVAINTNIQLNNSVIYNSGTYCLQVRGGSYEFNHCTFANYFSFSWIARSTSSIMLSNYVLTDESYVEAPLAKADFNNCIVYGTWSNEVTFNNKYNAQDVSATFNYNFLACLLKIKTSTIIEEHYQNVIFNQDPLFTIDADNYTYDFHLKSSSDARGTADNSVAQLYPFDMDGNSRLSDGRADIGAYEYIVE